MDASIEVTTRTRSLPQPITPPHSSCRLQFRSSRHLGMSSYTGYFTNISKYKRHLDDTLKQIHISSLRINNLKTHCCWNWVPLSLQADNHQAEAGAEVQTLPTVQPFISNFHSFTVTWTLHTSFLSFFDDYTTDQPYRIHINWYKSSTMRRLFQQRLKSSTSDVSSSVSASTTVSSRKTFPSGIKLLYNAENCIVEWVDLS